jgi:hypothetical protein
MCIIHLKKLMNFQTIKSKIFMSTLERLISISQSHVNENKDLEEKPESYWIEVRKLIQLQCQLIKLKYHGN